jgi:hypothetical protein
MVTLAVGAIAMASQAAAQDPVGRRGGWGQQDMNRDQAKQAADSMFQRLDTNKDGSVTRAEADAFAAQFGDRATRMVDRLFAGAQAVTLQQAEAQALARFDREDLDHNGIVTAAEHQQARTAAPRAK